MWQRKYLTRIRWISQWIYLEVLIAKVLYEILNLSQARYKGVITNQKSQKNNHKAAPGLYIF